METSSILQTGIYRHYKGGEYEVIVVGRLEATLEEVVVYKSLYAAKDFPVGTVWVRSLSSFTEMVTINGQTVQRFTYVGPTAS